MRKQKKFPLVLFFQGTDVSLFQELALIFMLFSRMRALGESGYPGKGSLLM